MSSWIVPEANTRTGSSHSRRGVVCQDASGWRSQQDRSGEPVHLMVVADGHGGKRYIHSDVGSRLACELSLDLVSEQLGQWNSVGRGALQRWQEWLESTFPKALHQRWLAAVETHWRQECTKTDPGEAPFSPKSYGTTIALVMMTPAWWGHTGLGDWDLVRIGSDHEVELVNEEQEEDQTGGESTYSLCLSNAPRHFAARTAVHPITELEPPFTLLLSTDGVRKSCSTDADFFTIVRYLCEAEQPRQGDSAAQLSADLDRISSQGSGDDVSVAIGRWAVLDERLKSQRTTRRLSRRLQSSRGQIIQPRIEDSGHSTGTAATVRNSLHDHGRAVATGTTIAEDQDFERQTRRCDPWLVGVLVLLSAAALGVAGMFWLGLGPFSRGDRGAADPSLELAAVLRREADALCGRQNRSSQTPEAARANDSNRSAGKAGDDGNTDQRERNLGNDLPDSRGRSLPDDFITESLNPRRSTFQDLARGSKTPDAFLLAPSTDPRGALIAWSFLHPSLDSTPVSSPKATGVLSRFSGVLPHWMRSGESAPPRGSANNFCPELRQALESQRKRAKSETAGSLAIPGMTLPRHSSSQKIKARENTQPQLPSQQ